MVGSAFNVLRFTHVRVGAYPVYSSSCTIYLVYSYMFAILFLRFKLSSCPVIIYFSYFYT